MDSISDPHSVITVMAQACSVVSGQGTQFKVKGVGHTTLYFFMLARVEEPGFVGHDAEIKKKLAYS